MVKPNDKVWVVDVQGVQSCLKKCYLGVVNVHISSKIITRNREMVVRDASFNQNVCFFFTGPRPAFGWLGPGGSSGGYGSHE